MAHRIEVAVKEGITDSTGLNIKNKIRRDLGIEAEDVRVVDVYTIDANLPQQHLDALAGELFTDPITHRSSLLPLANNFDWVVEVGYKPGVTDNTGLTASSAVRYTHGIDAPVYTSRQYVVKGVTGPQARQIANSLANAQIENMRMKHRSDWDPLVGMGVYVPEVQLAGGGVEYIDLDVSEERLMEISRTRELALNLEEMKALQERFKIMLDGELEGHAQTWSEHCKHKIFNGEITYVDLETGKRKVVDSLFKTYIRGATEELRRQGIDWIVSVFSDNAGIVRLDEEFNIADKAETHNSPSALDPYGGAITGVDGVARDIFSAGLGAREIGRADVLCFASPFYSGELPPRVFHPMRVYDGVRSGVRDGGNKCGIPTVNGSIRFDSYPFGAVREGGKIISYMGKPLVYVRSIGIMPALVNGKPSHEKKADAGDMVVVVGGKTGKDGIHGATFSSRDLHEKSPVTAVQLDEPITQKKAFDFQLVARDKGLYKSVTDNGAGGLCCSVGEMARESGGAELCLDKIPLKYRGMRPWEILLSESQDRMTLAVHQGKIGEFLDLAKRMGTDATVVGTFNDTGYFKVAYDRELVANMEMEFLHNGVPKKRMRAEWKQPKYEEPRFAQPDLVYAILEMLARPNIASKETTVRMYDHEVQAQTVVKPFTGAKNDGPSDAAVVWPLEMQRKGSMRGLSVGHGINPNYGMIDTYHMAALNISEAISNVVSVGADPQRISLLDNFCWSSSDDPYRLAQLLRACKACYDYTLAFGTPLVSGKDSMFNDYTDKATGIKISVPPTLLISSLGVVNDISRAVTMDAKKPGNIIYAVGFTHAELGGSEYFAMMGSREGEVWIGNRVPKVDMSDAKGIFAALGKAVNNGYVAACHDCSDGGLGVALAEMALAGDCGMNVYLDRVLKSTYSRADYILFSESSPRFVVEVPPEYAPRFENLIGVYANAIGEVTRGRFSVNHSGRNLIDSPVGKLRDAWQQTLNW